MHTPWPAWPGAGWDFPTWEIGFSSIEGNCLDVSRAMGWSDINLVNYMSWGNAYSSMNDAAFEETMGEVYDDYDDFRDSAGIEYVLVTTTEGDVLLPLNLLLVYEIDSAGNLLDPEAAPGIHDAAEPPNGLYLTRSLFGLRFTDPDASTDTGG
jgi:hypothetical protein